MADTAAHLVDCVLPEAPIRQWVLTLPYPLRYRCAYDAALTSDILRAFLRALFSALRRRAKSQWDTPRGQCGSVTFIQRFGSALNLNLHFHTLALDRVYSCDKGNATRFLPYPRRARTRWRAWCWRRWLPRLPESGCGAARSCWLKYFRPTLGSPCPAV